MTLKPMVLFAILSWLFLQTSSTLTAPAYIPHKVTCQGDSACESGFLTLTVVICENDRKAIRMSMTAMILNLKRAYHY